MSDTNDNFTWKDITVQAIVILQDSPQLDDKSNEYYFTGKGKRTLSDCGTYLQKAQFANVRCDTLEESQEMFDLISEAIAKNGSFGIEKSIKIDSVAPDTETL